MSRSRDPRRTVSKKINNPARPAEGSNSICRSPSQENSKSAPARSPQGNSRNPPKNRLRTIRRRCQAPIPIGLVGRKIKVRTRIKMGPLLIPNKTSSKKRDGALRSEVARESDFSSRVSSREGFSPKMPALSKSAYRSEKRRKAKVTAGLRIVGRPSLKFPIVTPPLKKARLTRRNRNNPFPWNTVRSYSSESKIMPVRLSSLSPDTPPAVPQTSSAGGVVTQPEDRVREFRRLFTLIEEEVGRVIVGHHEVVRKVLTAFFAGGHVLIEGVP